MRCGFVLAVCAMPSIAIAADDGDAASRGNDDDEDWYDDAHPEPAVHIPEPMVFDLVRGLGAHRGELEVNVLSQFPLHRKAARPVEWAPEIELAVHDGVGLELELPMADGHVEAYKLAAQVTFTGLHRKRFLHGVQAIGEKIKGHDVVELAALYIPVLQVNPWVSVVTMIGGRVEAGGESRDETFLFNSTVFLEPNRETAFGLELNVAAPRDGRTTALLMPQLYRELDEHLNIQVGVGTSLGEDRRNWTCAMRLVWGTEIEFRGAKPATPKHARRN